MVFVYKRSVPEVIMSKVKPRDTYKYHVIAGNRVVYGGTTKSLKHREQEHKKKRPKGRVVQVGHRTTKEAAQRWERDNFRVVKSAKRSTGFSESFSRSGVTKAVERISSEKTRTTSKTVRSSKKK